MPRRTVFDTISAGWVAQGAIALRSDFDTAISHLLRAPFESGHWIPALVATARATGSVSAGLTAADTSQVPRFALSPLRTKSEMAEVYAQWCDLGGNDPRRNPLVACVLRVPVLHVVSDADVITAEERRRHPLWNEFYDRLGLPHYGVCALARIGGDGLVIQVSRSRAQGPLTDIGRRTLLDLSVHWREAIMLSRTLRAEGVKLLTGALDRLSVLAVVLDGFGRIVGLTPAAELHTRAGDVLRLRNGSLLTLRTEYQSRLDAMVRCAVGNLRNEGKSAVLHLPGRCSRGATLRAWPLPRENDIGFGAAAMVLIEPRATIESALDRAGLTKSERAVIHALFAGCRIDHIARQRDVSIQTVRSQIKSIYAKMGIHTRAGLMALRTQ